MEKYKEEFIEFLFGEEALKIGGPFKLKSGRMSPYFINTGVFADGEGVRLLGHFYASKINDKFNEDEYSIIFGPAYKGIPLAVATSIDLSATFDTPKKYLFDRKVPKKHGEATTTEDFAKNWLVGNLQDEDTVVIVDDVFTTGETKYDSIDLLNKCAENLKFVGLVISVDRQEVGEEELSAIETFVKTTNIPVEAITNITEVVEYLFEKKRISSVDKKNVKKYLEKYGTIEAKRSVEKWK